MVISAAAAETVFSASEEVLSFCTLPSEAYDELSELSQAARAVLITTAAHSVDKIFNDLIISPYFINTNSSNSNSGLPSKLGFTQPSTV